MHRLLERLDNAAAQIVPLLYLAGLMLGAASYFAGVMLDAGLAVGAALATAAELHSFLQQRRLRASYAQLQRLADDAPEREAMLRQVKVNAWILAALLSFSAYNAIAFTAATWRPSSGFLPPWLQIGIRGLVVPGFFFLSGFLSPLQSDASEQLQTASADMLRRTLKAIARQWRARLDKARSRGADLAGVAVALMLDAGDAVGARRIELIAQGLITAERPQIAPALEDAPAIAGLPATADTTAARVALDTPEQPEQPTGPDRPPTGPGSPTERPAQPRKRSDQRAAVLQLPTDRPAQPRKRAAVRASGATSAASKATGVRTPRKSGQSLEADARAAWAAGARTINAMMVMSGMSRNAAGGWVRTLKAEQATSSATSDASSAGQLAQ